VATLPIERDLTEFSRRGVTLVARLVPALTTFPIAALIVGGITFDYYSGGREHAIAISIFLVPFAVFSIVLGLWAVFVGSAPGATWIRIDEDALTLRWPSGHTDVYSWRSWRTHFVVDTFPRSPTRWSPTPTMISSFWRPPSMIPEDLVPILVNLLERSSLHVTTYTTRIRRRTVLRREVRGSHHARVDLGAL